MIEKAKMKKSIVTSAIAIALIAIGSSLCSCVKKTETAPEKSAANYPLPEPPLVASCDPGVPGGRLVIG